MSSRSLRPSDRVTGISVVGAVACLFVTAAASSVHGAFHQWQIKEAFTNSTGSVQFIELFDSSTSENFISGFSITANSDGNVKTFTFGSDLVGETAGHYLLVASTGFGSLAGGVTPDYTFAAGGASLPFFNPNATNISISFNGSGDTISFTGASLPRDGIRSLTDGNLYGTQSLTAGNNSPTNFGGSSGSVNLSPEPGTASLLMACSFGMLCRRRRASRVP